MADNVLSMSEIKLLSDTDLRDVLKSNNINAGPVGKMRGVYEKRLFKNLHGHDFGKKPTGKTPVKTVVADSPVMGNGDAGSTKTPKTRTVKSKSPGRPKSTPKSPPRQVSRSPARPRSVSPQPASVNIDFESLDNADIRSMIRKAGEACGPIPNASIRKLMIKKLQRMHDSGKLNSRDSSQDSHDEPTSTRKVTPGRTRKSQLPTSNSRKKPSTPTSQKRLSRQLQLDANTALPQFSSTINSSITAQFSSEEDDTPDTTEKRSGLLRHSKPTTQTIPDQRNNISIHVSSGIPYNVSITKSADSPSFVQSSSNHDDFSATEDELEPINADTPPTTSWGQELSNASRSILNETNEMYLESSRDDGKSFNKSDNPSPQSYQEKRRSYARLAAGVADTSKILNKPTLLDRSKGPGGETENNDPSTFSKFVQKLPKMLVGFVLFIFLIIFVAAYFQKSDVNEIECISDDPSLCNSAAQLGRETEAALQGIRTQLNDVAGLAACGETSQNPKMKLLDLAESVGGYSVTSVVIQKILGEFLSKPAYGVALLDSADTEIRKVDEFNSVDKLYMVNPQEHSSCKLAKLRQEVYEYIWNATTQKILTALLLVAITVKIFHYKYKMVKMEQDLMDKFVGEILDHAENKVNQIGQNYIAITHLRDTLIPHAEREKLNPIWESAIESIRQNESRVQFSQQDLNGEQCEVIQWSCNVSPVYSDRWKGSAVTASRSHKIQNAPQHCKALKIRDFYTEHGQISNKVKKAQLLNELMGQVNTTIGPQKLEPMHYDFEDGCIYVRFSTEQDAVSFYNAIHATWFDERLLTPKFIHDEKYYHRFPNAQRK